MIPLLGRCTELSFSSLPDYPKTVDLSNAFPLLIMLRNKTEAMLEKINVKIGNMARPLIGAFNKRLGCGTVHPDVSPEGTCVQRSGHRASSDILLETRGCKDRAPAGEKLREPADVPQMGP